MNQKTWARYKRLEVGWKSSTFRLKKTLKENGFSVREIEVQAMREALNNRCFGGDLISHDLYHGYLDFDLFHKIICHGLYYSMGYYPESNELTMKLQKLCNQIDDDEMGAIEASNLVVSTIHSDDDKVLMKMEMSVSKIIGNADVRYVTKHALVKAAQTTAFEVAFLLGTYEEDSSWKDGSFYIV